MARPPPTSCVSRQTARPSGTSPLYISRLCVLVVAIVRHGSRTPEHWRRRVEGADAKLAASIRRMACRTWCVAYPIPTIPLPERSEWTASRHSEGHHRGPLMVNVGSPLAGRRAHRPRTPDAGRLAARASRRPGSLPRSVPRGHPRTGRPTRSPQQVQRFALPQRAWRFNLRAVAARRVGIIMPNGRPP
jgi:hypothetical protein